MSFLRRAPGRLSLLISPTRPFFNPIRPAPKADPLPTAQWLPLPVLPGHFSRRFSSTRQYGSKERTDEDEGTVGRRGDRRPWHRASDRSEGTENFPPSRNVDPTKGRVLTTPTRLFKLILPLPLHPDQQSLNEIPSSTPPRKYTKPLALLVHPHQPLSYVASLIQAELPPLKTPEGATRLPSVHFRASEGEDPSSPAHADTSRADAEASRLAANWMRWSGSTEVGDFVRDAARGGAFVVDIEGLSPQDLDGDGRRDVGGVRVAVPTFGQRTYYMRRKLRGMSARIEEMAKLKRECDMIARRGAHRLAKAGFVFTGAWWFLVYYASFHTELTWDVMEPITYLAGLIVIMVGYWYFLYMSRDLSYKEALRMTVSKRQQALYHARGLDVDAWEALVHETNLLRKDIRVVAEEYAVEWDEAKDLGGEEVIEELEKEEGERIERGGRNDERKRVEKKDRKEEKEASNKRKDGD